MKLPSSIKSVILHMRKRFSDNQRFYFDTTCMNSVHHGGCRDCLPQRPVGNNNIHGLNSNNPADSFPFLPLSMTYERDPETGCLPRPRGKGCPVWKVGSPDLDEHWANQAQPKLELPNQGSSNRQEAPGEFKYTGKRARVACF